MTTVAILVEQLADPSDAGIVFHEFLGVPQFLSEHWIAISILLQLLLMLLITLACMRRTKAAEALIISGTVKLWPTI